MHAILTLPMRLNRTGVAIIAPFLGVGLILVLIGALFASRDATGVWFWLAFGGVWLAATLVAVLVAVRAELRARHNRRLARTGTRGKATVVSSKSGEIAVNEAPLVELTLDVELPGEAPRRIERRLLVEPFAARRMEPGLVLPVYANPRDPDDLLIVW
jgi:membrane protein implicated in regulation of membrane protease activity